MSAADHAARPYRRIAVEEAFQIPEILEALKKRANNVPSMSSGPIAGPSIPLLLDIEDMRLAAMDKDGIDTQLLAITSPGVQLFAPADALALARLANDRLSEIVAKRPDRFQGLATIPPQAPAEAAKELERAVQTLGLRGAMINSHTNGEYLDDRKYWPILEAAEALDVPVYIHPREPSPSLAGCLVPGYSVGWAFAVETGTHAVKLLGSGVFDEMPKLKIVLGHLGETIPFLLPRMDNRNLWETRNIGVKQLKRRPSEYFRENFFVATSGMNYAAPLRAAIELLGADRIMFAVDYPQEDQTQVVADFDTIPLSDAERKAIYEDNVRRIFRF